MSGLRLFSEPFARTGNISAEGFRNLLGRPSLGLLQTALRESVQNVLDASRSDRGPRVALRLRTLDPEQRDALASRIFTSLPSSADSDRLLSEFLTAEAPRVLEIADFNTTGLAGPTRADTPSDAGEDPDFVNFVRNVGAARDTIHGGGTYGYGKTSLYALSGCSTIVVDSETTFDDAPIRRLIGCHLGEAFDAVGADGVRRRFTGRHWWGVPDGDNGIDPAEEDLARELAGVIGMPSRDRGESGTTIMVLDPILAGRNPQVTEQEFVETILWNFWPRMTEATPENRRLDVSLELENREVPVPRPECFPPLDLFAAAMCDHRAGVETLRPIRCHRPMRHLGALALRRGMRADRVGRSEPEASLLPEQSCHIALMRPVELVVRYIEGEAYPDRRFEWAGVFICSDDDDVEKAFALAEPPAHDDWIPDNLPAGPDKTWVRVALRRLNEIARTHADPKTPLETSGERGPSLARTATRLGRVLEAASGQGPGRKPGRDPGPPKRKSTRISQPEFLRLELGDGGKPLAWFRAELTNDGTDPELCIVAKPYLVADGAEAGPENLPEEYRLKANSLEIEGSELSGSGERLLVGERGGRVLLSVPVPTDAAVGVRLRLEGTKPS